MSHSDLAVERAWGGLVVRADKHNGMEHRWWFDETDDGRLVFCGEIIEFANLHERDLGLDARHYVDEKKMAVPTRVRERLAVEGYKTIFDLEGRPT